MTSDPTNLHETPCESCAGTGFQHSISPFDYGDISEFRCEDCKGEGFTVREDCDCDACMELIPEEER